MRVLCTTIGSRGDVQPILALAIQLRADGHDVRICAPPDFRGLFDGFSFTPLGPELRSTGKVSAMPTPEERQRMVDQSIDDQFEALTTAADGCDVLLVGGYLLVAGRTAAERLGIRYVWAGFSPNMIPSPHHAPPVFPMLGPAPEGLDNAALWAQDTYRYGIFRDALNRHRVGLAPVDDVRGHLFSDTPWLAADPWLAPWQGDSAVVQTGAWMVHDTRPLDAELEAFLNAGDPPIYFGFGSIRVPQDLTGAVIEAARELGKRVIVLRGWADLSLIDSAPDCIAIGEVNQQALFRRVAAAVHHGGAGTTTAATLAGAPQVIIPQHSDQFYFAGQVETLGIGVAHSAGMPTTESLTHALTAALQPDVASRANNIGGQVRTDGAAVAARLLAS